MSDPVLDLMCVRCGFTEARHWQGRCPSYASQIGIFESSGDVLADLAAAPVVPAERPHQSVDDVPDIYVPGNWTCPKCNFGLSSQTLFMQSGTIGCTHEQVMAMTGEVCPNDGEPMRRVTWRERADDNQKWGLGLMEQIIALTGAEHLPGALERIKAAASAADRVSALTSKIAQLETWLWEDARLRGRSDINVNLVIKKLTEIRRLDPAERPAPDPKS